MENKKDFIIYVLYYAIIFALVYFFCNYVLGILAPFIVGFLFAYLAIKLARKMFKKESKGARIAALLIVYLIIIVIMVLLAILGINELTDFIKTIPTLYKTYVEPVLEGVGSNINHVNTNIPISIQNSMNDIINNFLDSIQKLVSSISTYIVSGTSSLISNTTSALISGLTLIITSFFVVVDFENIVNYLESLMSEKTKKIYDDVKDFLLNTVFLVIKSYIIIMFVTFVELLIGLSIIGVKNSTIVSMVIAILDILPVLGVGTALIPWGIFKLIAGDTFMGVSILVLYLIITIIRNILEPKIVGGNLNLHPLATLFAMLIGLEVFGVLGLFGLPLTLSFFVKRNRRLKDNK